ncbi:dihydropteroate synthase [Rhodopirellula sp. JC740]|uniref:Dihydropteroate synthase n=1 Tax=Rhodopirellula halodulae TaxID=2894198 RepID=A0ABS8NG13_9BACT|nr:dihydropteroate synthase [Rhodopirellula sp. JC740]MCC9641426.1 dihydropteroate synthase [Rhodopirellula sp. JC740]
MIGPSVWQTSKRRLQIGRRPLVMGILNVTPDSFSDGGRFVQTTDSLASQTHVEKVVQAALQMRADGADIIDIGGESTRPYSQPVDPKTESARVIPVIERLVSECDVPISIDTSKASVAKQAMIAGAEIINDVTGLEGDPEMAHVAKECEAGVCVMHMQGTPQTMQDDPSYKDVVSDIRQYLQDRLQSCLDFGIDRERICLDPGIGFGKSHDHNLDLLRATSQFASLGVPILIGHSRKGFIKKVLKRSGRIDEGENGDANYDPLAGSLGVSLAVAAAGAHVIRVHDVAQTVQAMDLFEASGGLGPI